MKRLFSQHALNVFQFTLEVWPHDLHTHNFYELILINEGRGKHEINDVSFSYAKGDVFLLTPEDKHVFEIDVSTTFTYVKFTEQIFLEKQQFDQQYIGQQKVKDLLYNPNTIPESIIKDQEDKRMLFQLVAMLLKEFKGEKSNTRGLVLELFGAVLHLVLRNLSQKNVHVSKVKQIENERVGDVLSFIRQNINQPDLLTQKHIAEQFYLSPHYVSVYLKKHTGMGLQNMITETRLKTAERLLKQSTLNISQIALKVGFNDASHMNKMFQKYRSKNPIDYRK